MRAAQARHASAASRRMLLMPAMSTASKRAAPRTGGGTALGVAMALFAVLIWASWFVATRHGVSVHLGPIDIGLFRFSVPALLLAPVWMRCGLVPKRTPPASLALIVVGSGTGFVLSAANGLALVPAAYAGTLLPASMTLLTAAIGRALLGERIGRWRASGYALIVAGIGLLFLASASGDAGPWYGYGLLGLAGLLWASYTHALRGSGLTALEATAVMAAWSFLIHVALAALLGTEIPSAPLDVMAVQLVAQGLFSGLLAIVAFGVAVARLGATPASAFGALVPVIAAIGGVTLLGERPSPLTYPAILCVAAGVVSASGWRPPFLRRPATVPPA